MTDPASTALAAPRLALGDGAAAYEAAVERARTEDWATRLFARDVTLWSSDPARRRGHRRAARLARCAGALRRPDRRPRGRSGTRSSTRATRRPSSPAWAAAASRRTSCTGRSGRIEGYLGAAHPRLDRPGLRVGHARRPRPAADARHHRLQVGHDDRAERLPGLRLGARRGARSKAVPHHRYEHPGAYFAAITDPGRASRRIAHHDDFREVFLNPPDIGGRYSALTLCRARAGVAHRDRPRRAAGVGRGDARGLPRAGSGDQPGRLARARHRRPWRTAAATS